MRWHVHGERTIYTSDWLDLAVVDVEIPGGPRFDHHVVRFPRPAAGVVVHDPARGVLLLWRHRFITDEWGWEIPGGRVEAGESIEQGAAREALEESGWEPGPLVPVCSFHPATGVSDQTFHIYLADGATHRGAPVDASESERIEWVTLAEVRALIRRGEIRDGLSLTGLSTALALGML
jgi:8-oxo-dGTP pyrophosphatase MutT (NUDIX family)